VAGRHGADYSVIPWLRRPRAPLRDANAPLIFALVIVPIVGLGGDGIRRIGDAGTTVGAIELMMAVGAATLVVLYLLRPVRGAR
jgi:hypothetical protein